MRSTINREFTACKAIGRQVLALKRAWLKILDQHVGARRQSMQDVLTHAMRKIQCHDHPRDGHADARS